MEQIELKDFQQKKEHIFTPNKGLNQDIIMELKYLFNNKPERKRILIILDNKDFKIVKKPMNKETFVDRNINRYFSEGFKNISFQTIIMEREMIIGDKLTIENKKEN